MSKKIKVIPTDVYENGDLIRIDFHDLDGKHQIQAVWDENDPQDSEHRAAFRKWAYRFISQLEFEVLT